MDRAETVRLLAEVFQAEGYSDRWRTLMDCIREHGPIHDPEYVECAECGAEFEPPPHDRNSSTGWSVSRCQDCIRLAKNARERRRYDRRIA